MNKDTKRIKKIRLKNKKLLKEYPFLVPISWTGKKIPKKIHKYEYTEYDSIPDGWKIAFGPIFLEDLKEQLVKEGNFNDYCIVQVKEKFGELRWYDAGHSKKVGEIIDNYSMLSGNICIECGRPDVALLNIGWFTPLCRKCFEKKYAYKNEKYEDFFDENQEEKMAKTRVVIRYNKNGNNERIEYDLTEIADRIRKRWNKNHKNDKVEI